MSWFEAFTTAPAEVVVEEVQQAGFFITLLIWAVITVVTELIRPKPNFENARPAGLGDFRFPTATEGRAIPLIWGTVKLEAPNVVWYGNLRIKRLTEEVKTGMFSSEDVTTGYKYFVGMQFALCRGEIDKILTGWVNDKVASGGRTGPGGMTFSASLGGSRGAGTLTGSGSLYTGTQTQLVDSYLATEQSLAPAYRGVAYWVFQDGLVGTSPNIPPFAFEVQRINDADGLNLAISQPGDEIINNRDANPMNVIYEILTDDNWGLGISGGEIDTVTFKAAAATLATEGNGFSMILDGQIEAKEFLIEIQRQIDGVVYYDRSDGLWKVALARDDYTPASLPLYDENNSALEDYSRLTWEETTNQVHILYEDNNDNYKRTYAMAQDMGNAELQGRNVSVDISFPGCKNAALANKLAWRELATLSYPFAKLNITMNREGFDLLPGSVFRFSWDNLNISEMVFRVSRIDYGTLGSGTITVFAVEDIFTDYSGVFTDPPISSHTDPEDAPVAPVSADTVIFEAPRQVIIQDSFDSGLFPRIWAGARDPGGGTVSFSMYTRFGTAPLSGSFEPDASIGTFLLAGELDVDLPAYGSNDARPYTSGDIQVTNNSPDDLAILTTDDSKSRVRSLRNICWIDGEFIGYEQIAFDDPVYDLKRIYRGLFHTAPKAHAAGTRVYFIGQTGGNLNNTSINTNPDGDVKLRSQSFTQILDESAVPTESISIDDIQRVPLAPRDPTLEDNYAPSSETMDTQHTSETGRTGDDARSLKTEFVARNWRIDDPMEDHILSLADYLEDTPVFDVVLELDPNGTPAQTTAVVISAASASPSDDPENPECYILRNEMIKALGANVAFPTEAKLIVTAKASPPEETTQQTNPVDMEFEFDITSSLQSDDLRFGGLTVNVISALVTFNETGSYAFDIHTALPSSGILEGRINGGSFATIVSAASSTGNLSVTAGDTVELRFTQAPSADQFFDITGPTSETGYGVLNA